MIFDSPFLKSIQKNLFLAVAILFRLNFCNHLFTFHVRLTTGKYLITIFVTENYTDSHYGTQHIEHKHSFTKSFLLNSIRMLRGQAVGLRIFRYVLFSTHMNRIVFLLLRHHTIYGQLMYSFETDRPDT